MMAMLMGGGVNQPNAYLTMNQGPTTPLASQMAEKQTEELMFFNMLVRQERFGARTSFMNNMLAMSAQQGQSMLSPYSNTMMRYQSTYMRDERLMPLLEERMSDWAGGLAKPLLGKGGASIVSAITSDILSYDRRKRMYYQGISNVIGAYGWKNASREAMNVGNLRNYTAGIANMLDEERGPRGEDLTGLWTLATQRGMLKIGNQDFSRYKADFKELVKSTKEVSKILGTSLQEALPVLQELKQYKITLGKIKTTMAQVKATAQSAGVSTSNVMGMAMATAQQTSRMGFGGRVGFNIANANLVTAGVARNFLSADDLNRVGGTQGLAMVQNQLALGFLNSRYGKLALYAGIGNKMGAGFDNKLMADWISGRVSDKDMFNKADAYFRDTDKQTKYEIETRKDQYIAKMDPHMMTSFAIAKTMRMMKKEGVQYTPDAMAYFLNRKMGIGMDQAKALSLMYGTPQGLEKMQKELQAQMEQIQANVKEDMIGHTKVYEDLSPLEKRKFMFDRDLARGARHGAGFALFAKGIEASIATGDWGYMKKAYGAFVKEGAGWWDMTKHNVADIVRWAGPFGNTLLNILGMGDYGTHFRSNITGEQEYQAARAMFATPRSGGYERAALASTSTGFQQSVLAQIHKSSVNPFEKQGQLSASEIAMMSAMGGFEGMGVNFQQVLTGNVKFNQKQLQTLRMKEQFMTAGMQSVSGMVRTSAGGARVLDEIAKRGGLREFKNAGATVANYLMEYGTGAGKSYEEIMSNDSLKAEALMGLMNEIKYGDLKGKVSQKAQDEIQRQLNTIDKDTKARVGANAALAKGIEGYLSGEKYEKRIAAQFGRHTEDYIRYTTAQTGEERLDIITAKYGGENLTDDDVKALKEYGFGTEQLRNKKLAAAYKYYKKTLGADFAKTLKRWQSGKFKNRGEENTYKQWLKEAAQKKFGKDYSKLTADEKAEVDKFFNSYAQGKAFKMFLGQEFGEAGEDLDPGLYYTDQENRNQVQKEVSKQTELGAYDIKEAGFGAASDLLHMSNKQLSAEVKTQITGYMAQAAKALLTINKTDPSTDKGEKIYNEALDNVNKSIVGLEKLAGRKDLPDTAKIKLRELATQLRKQRNKAKKKQLSKKEKKHLGYAEQHFSKAAAEGFNMAAGGIQEMLGETGKIAGLNEYLSEHLAGGGGKDGKDQGQITLASLEKTFGEEKAKEIMAALNKKLGRDEGSTGPIKKEDLDKLADRGLSDHTKVQLKKLEGIESETVESFNQVKQALAVVTELLVELKQGVDKKETAK